MAASDRFGGPLNPGDIFPSTMEPLHPLNPAELSYAKESTLQFGFQGDGRSLTVAIPNFLVAMTGGNVDWPEASGPKTAYAASKYEVGYGISTADLGWTEPGGASLALGVQLRYLEFSPSHPDTATRLENAYGDLGVSAAYHRFRADFACLNLARTPSNGQATYPGSAPREFNFGLAYGIASDWLISARLGFQDSNRGEALVDVGFEKLFFRNLTFRFGSQRRYAYGEDAAAREISSSLAGGIWYRINSTGINYRYPDRDGDLFSLATFLRMVRDVQVGGSVQLTKSTDAGDIPSASNTSLLATVGKSF